MAYFSTPIINLRSIIVISGLIFICFLRDHFFKSHVEFHFKGQCLRMCDFFHVLEGILSTEFFLYIISKLFRFSNILWHFSSICVL